MPDSIKLAQNAYIEGLNDLRQLLDPPDDLVIKPWREAMQNLVDEGIKGVKASAPQRSGQTQARIFGKFQSKSFPAWLAIRSRGVRKSKAYPRGYPYPRLLNYSTKHGHAGWFDRGITPMLEKAESALAEAGRVVAQKWGE